MFKRMWSFCFTLRFFGKYLPPLFENAEHATGHGYVLKQFLMLLFRGPGVLNFERGSDSLRLMGNRHPRAKRDL